MIFPGWELDIAQASSIQTGNSDVMGVEFPKYRELFFELLIVFRHMAAAIVNGVQRNSHVDHNSRHDTAAISQKGFFRLGRCQDENGQALEYQAQRQQQNESRLK